MRQNILMSGFLKRISIILLLVCGLNLYGTETPSPQKKQELSSCEEAFKARGFHEGYTRLYDEVTTEWLPLAERLRRGEVDPEEDHIKEFADKIPEHLNFIFKEALGDDDPGNRYDYLQDSDSSSIKSQLEKLFRTKFYQDLEGGEDDHFKIHVQLSWLDESGSEFDELEEELFFNRMDEDRVLLSQGFDISQSTEEYHIGSIANKLGLQSRLLSILAILLSDDIAPQHRNAVEFRVFLTEYVNLAIQNRAVTYKWWLNLNEAIKRLLESTDMDFIDLEVLSEGINSNGRLHPLLRSFPDEIVMPSVVGEVGIMAMNRVVPKGVYVYGLGKNEEFYTIEEFMEHDEGHITEIRASNLRGEPAYNLFHDKWVQAVEELPTDKRKNVEIVYNMLIFEDPTRFINKSPRQLKELLFREMPHLLFAEVTKIKRLSTNLPKQARQLEKMVDDFVELFSKIQTGQPPDTYPYTEEDFARVYNQSSNKDRTYHAEDFIIENGE